MEDNQPKQRPTTPHWPDHCVHLTNLQMKGIFLDTVIDNDHIVDIYIWKGESYMKPKPGKKQAHAVCIRYGEYGGYESCWHPAEEWLDEDSSILIGMGLDGPTIPFTEYCRTHRGSIVEVLRRDREIWDK